MKLEACHKDRLDPVSPHPRLTFITRIFFRLDLFSNSANVEDGQLWDCSMLLMNDVAIG